jgi:peptidoglycan/xylan/chitin deacetylase (PgdA/CDA1 family)
LRGTVEAARARAAIERRARGLGGTGAALGRAMRRPERVRGLALAMAAAVVVAAAIGFAQGGKSSAGGAGAAGRGRAAKGAPPPGLGGPLYRLVGCVSHGTAAYRQGPHRREVAIAFDDGPAHDTPAFVTMLERMGVRATFFLVGREVTAGYRTLLLRELRDGDALGDHTFNHANLVLSSRRHTELAATIARIQAVSGYRPCIFRPPYGAFDRRVLHEARALGLSTIMWNVDPRDWSTPGKGAIAGRILRAVTPGSIIISHDGGGPRGQTLAAYPGVIAALRRRGYRFVTVPELLRYRPVYRQCVKLCDGIGLHRKQLPRNAILQPAG